MRSAYCLKPAIYFIGDLIPASETELLVRRYLAASR